jgi:uncharacterized protein YdaU (DUF1376 family)
MAKDPAFLFYSSDFLTGTTFLSNEQVGMYIRALCHIHQSGHLTENQLKFICGGVDEDVFSKFKLDNDGLYYNERLEIEIIKRRKHSEKQRENVLKRWNKEDTNIIPPYKNGITSVIPLENENIDIDIDIDIIKEDNSNSIVIGENLKKKSTKSTYYPDDLFFIEQMALNGKRSCAKIDAPWVFLTDQNYHELINKFKHEELVKEMIKEYSGYKERKSLKLKKPTLTLDDKDVAGISASWVEVNAIKVLQARNSPVIAEIRKKEKMKEKFNQK